MENAPGSTPHHITTHQPAAPHHASLLFPLPVWGTLNGEKKNHKPPSGPQEQDQLSGHFLSTSWHSSLLCSRLTHRALALGLLPYGQCLNYWYYLYYCCASGPGHFCAGYCEESNKANLCWRIKPNQSLPWDLMHVSTNYAQYLAVFLQSNVPGASCSSSTHTCGSQLFFCITWSFSSSPRWSHALTWKWLLLKQEIEVYSAISFVMKTSYPNDSDLRVPANGMNFLSDKV